MEQGILKITEQERGEIEAHAVKIEITVEGERLLYGNAAFEKCEEVKKAVERLKTVDPEIGIFVKGIQVKSESGWFSKASKGVYRLELMLKSLDSINDVLGIILDMKNVNMNSMEWIFNDDNAKIELIKKAMIKAKNKADSMTSVVGYRVTGIRACSDSYDVPIVKATLLPPYNEPGFAMTSRTRAMSTADMGTEIKGRKEITATVSVEFCIDKEIHPIT